MRSSLLVILVCLILRVSLFAGDAVQEKKKLEGTWTVVAIEAAGKTLPVNKVGIEQIIITADTVTLKMQGREGSNFGWLVDAMRRPKWIDWIREKDKTLLPGIYTIEKEELRVCLPLVSPEKNPAELLLRPDSFDTKDKLVMLLVAKRGKP
jgi:uncharacterized protein (TIGR03067 family)